MVRILVVEDDAVQARLLSFLLGEEGFAVEVADSAERGYELILQHPFDAVLSDLLLPGESGFDLCRRIKGHPEFRHLLVVLLTSQIDPINVLRGLEAGADGFMTKNRELAENIGRLERILAQRAPTADNHVAPTSTRVVFLDQEFEFAATREQLLNVVLFAFEDVVHLNQQHEKSEAALRKLNVQLKEAVRSEQQAFEQLKKAESQLVQAEKLSSLGKMVGGVAHEINNPLAFIRGNMAVLDRDTAALRELLRLYQEVEAALGNQQPELWQRVREYAEEIDAAYTLDNLAGLLRRSADGLQRIQQIVKGLKDFARLNESELKHSNLNDGIEATIAIIRDKANKKQVNLHLELTPLPHMTCHPAKINQVVMSLVDNAIDACGAGGQVTVRSRAVDGEIAIEVMDTGRGIDPAIRSKIFDPFFTTKPPGAGTGLGLSIAYGIVQDHGGRIMVDSTPGQGTSAQVYLPLAPA